MFSKIKSKDKASKLREKLNAKGVIVMPGCFDSLSAKLIGSSIVFDFHLNHGGERDLKRPSTAVFSQVPPRRG